MARRSQSFRNRWLVYAVVAVLLGLAVSLVALLTNPRTSPIISAVTATVAPPTIVAALPTNAATATPVVSPTTATHAPSTPTLLPRLTPTPLPDSWEYEWLRGIPCRAPCWEGITPGKTTADEAVKILQQNNNISKIEKYPEDSDTGEVVWAKDLWNGGMFSYEAKTPPHPVFQIVTRLPHSISLSVVIQAYGEPDFVEAIATSNTMSHVEINYTLYFVFLSYGFYLTTDTDLENLTKPMLSPDTPVTYPQFFVPGKQGFLHIFTQLGMAETAFAAVRVWQGYKSFDFYCRTPKNESCATLLTPQSPIPER